MLHVTYETADRLESGKLADFREDRGHVKVRVAESATPAQYVGALNSEMQRFLDNAQWFQLWRDEIINRRHPEFALNVTYRLDDLEPGQTVKIREVKGHVDIRVQRDAAPAEFVAAINPAITAFLAGGQWFQLFGGEIVDMSSPDAMSHA
ncbi:hypothetical protein G3I51_23850 [Streptomyces sp. SID9944]|nr:hypothetical protein [Streptomyces sp. SID9944]